MSSKLKKLISYYEEERSNLVAQLDECIAETDYVVARRYSKGLNLVNQKLQVLYNLDDNLYDEKQRSIKLINALEEEIKSSDLEYGDNYYAKRIAAERESLDKLHEDSLAKGKKQERGVLDELLNNILEGELEGFTLVLSKSQNLCCNLKRVRRTLIISIPEARRHVASYLLYKKNIKQLKRVGFSAYDNKDKLMAFLPFSNQAELGLVKAVLARIAFEVFISKTSKEKALSST